MLGLNTDAIYPAYVLLTYSFLTIELICISFAYLSFAIYSKLAVSFPFVVITALFSYAGSSCS